MGTTDPRDHGQSPDPDAISEEPSTAPEDAPTGSDKAPAEADKTKKTSAGVEKAPADADEAPTEAEVEVEADETASGSDEATPDSEDAPPASTPDDVPSDSEKAQPVSEKASDPGEAQPDSGEAASDPEKPEKAVPGSGPTRTDMPLPIRAPGSGPTRVDMPLPIRTSRSEPPPDGPDAPSFGRPPGQDMPQLGRPSGRGFTRRGMLFGGLAAAGLTAVTAFAADELLSGGGGRSVRHSAGHAGMSAPHPRVPPKPSAPPASWTNAPLRSSRTPLFDLRELTPAPPPTAVALTIDDGPHPVYTPMMLDLLAENGIKATFSLIGSQVKMFPKLVARIAAAGHQISNHSQTHPSPFAEIGHDRIRREILEAKERIENVAGYSPKFFRSPGGDWNQYIFEQCRSEGMIPIAWNIDPRDWSRPGTTHIRKAMLAANAGDVLLCHDGGGDRRQTIDALRTVLPALRKRGLTFVAL